MRAYYSAATVAEQFTPVREYEELAGRALRELTFST